jgi:flagellar hook-associated protein 2
MALASISGLASGLDTAGIINQLMQLEALPQTKLKARVTAQQSSVTAFQSLNTKLAALATQAGTLAKTTAWSPVTASSSSEHVTVTTSAGATEGTLSFTVKQTALAHKFSFTDTAALTDRVTPADTTLVRFTAADGTITDLDTGDGTLDGLVKALNGAGLGVKASTVQLADGSHRLHVAATSTGAASQFSLSNVDPAAPALLGGENAPYTTTGRDAVIVLGPDELSSSTNTFTGVTTGVDFALALGTPGGTAVDISVTADAAGMTASVKSMVDAVNEILEEIDKVTAAGGGTTKAGVLSGDSTLRSLRNELLSSVYASGDGTSLADAGVELDRYGRLTFNEEKFTAAYAADPASVSAKFAGTGGFAERVAAVSNQASDTVTGTVTNAIQGRKSAIDRLDDAIDSWDVRLDARRRTLERQYTALESALGRLQSQGNWLAGQLAGLPKWS